MSNPPVSPSYSAEERMSSRRRLLLTVGSALAVSFLVIGVLVWAFASAWMNYHARTLLIREAEEIASNITTPNGRIVPRRYAWFEPHHRFSEPRIDPYFVQIFTLDGRLLHRSDNLRDLTAGAYPGTLLERPDEPDTGFGPLRHIRTPEGLLYAEVYPIRTRGDRVAAYIQVARFDPGIAGWLRRVALLLAVGLGALFIGLSGIIWKVAGRVLRPLESITEETRHINALDLSRRLPLPDGADLETAQLVATLNMLLDRLQQAFEETRRFTSDAAHELQTPLTVLLGHVEVALRRERSPEAYRRTLDLLRSEITHLIHTVRSLLTLARLDRENGILPRRQLDLSALVTGEAAPFNKAATQKGLTFTIEADEPVWVEGLPDLLENVVRNLLDNAVKYTPSGRVEVRVARNEADAVLTVTDTGPGIPADVLPRVTDRFFRAAPPDVPGSGLGLALVEQVVERHGGMLTITTPASGGTCVRITLPASAPPQSGHPAPDPALLAESG